jgi:predicted DNA-binding transcriptional regulator AlpA
VNNTLALLENNGVNQMLLSNNDNNLLKPNATAKVLGVSVGTLAVWRCTGRYPLRFIKIGKNVMYRQGDIDSFIESNVFSHTEGRVS